MSLRRRFVNLVSSNSTKCVYALRRIDVSRFFHPTTAITTDTRRMMPMKDSCGLPEPTVKFYSSDDSGGRMEFALLDDKVVATDVAGGAFLYDPDKDAVHPLPTSHENSMTNVVSHAVGNNLYFIDRLTNDSGTKRFQALERYPPESQFHYGRWQWHWRALPPPPLPPGVKDGGHDPTEIESFAAAVAGGERIWVSAASDDSGDVRRCTHLFDEETLAWSNEPAEWVLPFDAAGGEHVPELGGLWFGISSREHGSVFCAAASATRPPVMRAVLDDMAGAPEEWALVSARAVHLGSGKFCVARILLVAGEGKPRSYLAVFTGVEVLQREDGGEVAMVKRNSERYILPGFDPAVYTHYHWVL